MILNTSSSPGIKILEDQIEKLQNQVDSLQQKVFHLETLIKNSKYPLSDALAAPNARKTIQQGPLYTGRKKGALFDRK